MGLDHQLPATSDEDDCYKERPMLIGHLTSSIPAVPPSAAYTSSGSSLSLPLSCPAGDSVSYGMLCTDKCMYCSVYQSPNPATPASLQTMEEPPRTHSPSHNPTHSRPSHTHSHSDAVADLVQTAADSQVKLVP